MEGRIHSFESFGTVDGPGVRFVVFMQGCPLRCLYCHNPDSWDCNGGKLMSAQAVFQEIYKYRNYIKKGGMTLSGGEALEQIEFITELFSLCKKARIHTCLDTSGISYQEDEVWQAKFDALMKVCDLVLLDLKHIDDKVHQKLTGKSNEQILKFANKLSAINKPVWIRYVLVPTITDNTEHLMKLRSFVETLSNVEKIEVLPYHKLGVNKYEQLGIKYRIPELEAPSSEQIALANEILKGAKHD